MKKVDAAANTLPVWCNLVPLVCSCPNLVTVLRADRSVLVVVAVLDWPC